MYGICSIPAGLVFMDALTHLERASDHCSAIAVLMLARTNSDILGKAFEPEQRFESPDGSDIVFDRDYLGNTRGVGALPGPFASADAAEKTLW